MPAGKTVIQRDQECLKSKLVMWAAQGSALWEPLCSDCQEKSDLNIVTMPFNGDMWSPSQVTRREDKDRAAKPSEGKR